MALSSSGNEADGASSGEVIESTLAELGLPVTALSNMWVSPTGEAVDEHTTDRVDFDDATALENHRKDDPVLNSDLTGITKRNSSTNDVKTPREVLCLSDLPLYVTNDVSSVSSDDSNRSLCRICQSGRELGELYSPCLCSGSLKYCHRECLTKWIACQGCYTCEICLESYKVKTRIHRNILGWKSIRLTLDERLHIGVTVLALSFIICTLSWMAWSLLSDDPAAEYERSSMVGYVSYTVYIPMDLLGLCLIVVEINFVLSKIWTRWLTVNSDIVVYDRAVTSEAEGTDSALRENCPGGCTAANICNRTL